MAEQRLEGEPIDAGFQQVGRAAVPQRVHRAALGQADLLDQAAEAPLPVAGGDRPARLVAREEPKPRPGHAPVGPELPEQARRQQPQAVLGALALADGDHQAGAVDFADLLKLPQDTRRSRRWSWMARTASGPSRSGDRPKSLAKARTRLT